MRRQSEWEEVTLRDLCESVRYGYTASAQDKPVGPRFLRITDIVPELIDWSSVPYCEISSDDFEKYKLQRGDIVIARTGATTGYAKWVQPHAEAVFASYLVRVRIASEHCSRYIGFVVESDEYKQFIETNIGGAAQPNANAQVLTSFPLMLPPLPTQRKIAAILSAYDDLIENNACRIAILEEMAQLLYREWFVHLRFPGHEDVALVDSELGAIPEEWEVKKFSELAKKRHNRITPSEFETEVFSYHSFPTFDDNKLPKLELGADIGSAKYIVHKGSVLLSRLNPRISRVWLPHLNSEHRAIASTEFVVLLPKPPITRAYLYNLGRSTDFRSRFVGLTGGTSTSHQRVNHRDLLNMKVIYPSPDLIEAFSDITTPMLKLSNTLRLRNITIRHTRDLLIPRLVSGELDVSNLDISIGGS